MESEVNARIHLPKKKRSSLLHTNWLKHFNMRNSTPEKMNVEQAAPEEPQMPTIHDEEHKGESNPTDEEVEDDLDAYWLQTQNINTQDREEDEEVTFNFKNPDSAEFDPPGRIEEENPKPDTSEASPNFSEDEEEEEIGIESKIKATIDRPHTRSKGPVTEIPLPKIPIERKSRIGPQ